MAPRLPVPGKRRVRLTRLRGTNGNEPRHWTTSTSRPPPPVPRAPGSTRCRGGPATHALRPTGRNKTAPATRARSRHGKRSNRMRIARAWTSAPRLRPLLDAESAPDARDSTSRHSPPLTKLPRAPPRAANPGKRTARPRKLEGIAEHCPAASHGPQPPPPPPELIEPRSRRYQKTSRLSPEPSVFQSRLLKNYLDKPICDATVVGELRIWLPLVADAASRRGRRRERWEAQRRRQPYVAVPARSE